MRGYAVNNEIKASDTGVIEVVSETTKQVISKPVRIHDPNVLAVEVVFTTGATVADSASITVQDSMDNIIWHDRKSATVSNSAANVLLTIDSFVAGDATYIPLLPMIRVVASTGTGDTFEVEKVMIARMH